MNKKTRPIIKWTGGKYNEFILFENHIPSFNRYIEPFFGGGGVFFALRPQVKSFINDKSTDLINFYRQIGKIEFETELFKYADAWDEVGVLNEVLWQQISSNFTAYIQNPKISNDFVQILFQSLSGALKEQNLLSSIDFIVDFSLFNKLLLASIIDKAKRIKNIHEKEQRFFTADELKSHFETGIRSGVYLFFRKLLNQQFSKKIQLSEAKSAANWYFVREFCYASMFRFNAKGEFNIPYGGIAYNKKNFKQKVANIFDQSIAHLFKNTEIFNLDFEEFLNKIDLEPTDFIFLDPPYDSEFSEYDQNSFLQSDQQRLASLLIEIAAKWMVVIKETAFIRKIYTHPSTNITTFEKKYNYNVRGRNNRDVTHLIITNY